MSAQTGSMAPSGRASTRLVDRARFGVDRLQDEPNPIWVRELRQSARLVRTPWVLTVITVLMTLLIASIGGLVSADASPATTGAVLFQVFFSLAYFVVTVVGPAVAANSIASEREGRTWEAVILTGLSPATICRGKFLAAFTSIWMYIVALAPVGALPFLFGGVTATETVVAFAFLFLVALLSVAFGLAVSSKMESLRAAIVVTLLLVFPITIVAFLAFGPALSVAAHHAWPGVVEGPPIWLPIAYERARFDLTYVVFLLVVPVIAIVMPAWFLYEVTVANLTSVTDDRSSGLKRWFLVAAPTFTACAALPAIATSFGDRLAASVAGISVQLLFFSFAVFLFLGDPIGPSRRVLARWDLAHAGRLRRFLGPGSMRSAALLLVTGVLGLLALTGVAIYVTSGTGSRTEPTAIAAFGTYAIAFFVFIVGLGTYLRTRTTAPLVARVILFAVLFGVAVGPWIIAAIAGLLADHGGHEALLVGAPSPFYVFVMLEAITHGTSGAQVMAGMICSLGWAALGLVLLAAAGRKCGAIIRQHEALLAETDRILAAEDAPPADAAPDAAPPDEPSPAAAAS